MDSRSYKEFLLSHIQPWAKTEQGGRVVCCRCFYCSDSTHYNHGHFYINMPTETKPSYFYCQKCHTGGLVTSKKLLEWGLYDPDISVEISAHNNKVLNLPENRKFRDSEIYNIKNDIITEDGVSKYKLKYINDRLQTNLTYQDCKDMKIVLNLNDLISRNRLDITRDPNIINQLDSLFIGFLSYDNAFLNMRKLDIQKEVYKSIDKRYVNYNIFGKYDNTKRFYTIPNKIDLLDPRPIQLHIAEGPFDILGIRYNVRESIDRCVYSSIGGSGYEGLLRFFITELRTPNLEIHLYPDNDIDINFILRIINNISVFKFPTFIHRNVYPGEKDFGVPKTRIEERIERII